MLFTGKGDGGTTKTFNSKPGQRISKGTLVAEALGALDEVNSFLGLVKIASTKSGYSVPLEEGPLSFDAIVHSVQETLFIIQAEVAGFPKPLPEGKVPHTEHIINTIEQQLPPIKTFFISGGTELAALFDVARTFARRAERRVVARNDELKALIEQNTQSAESGDIVCISDSALAYLNRLSSLLYALARMSNHLAGVSELPPSYK